MEKKSRSFLGEFKFLVVRGEKMSDKRKTNSCNSELFDWMLAIDFDPAECKCSKKNANLIAEILFL